MAEMHPDQRLAIEGGPAAVPEGPPAWPLEDVQVHQILTEAYQSGDWGRYEADFIPRLCRSLSELHGTDFVLPCCSGTFAVELALRAVGIQPGDEVLLAGYDFPGNFRAIEALHAVPVLVDINPATWCLDVETLCRQMEDAAGTATRAVIVSHLHGGLADMAQITACARQNGVAVIEDACQAPGAKVQGKLAGSWGDVGVLSFGGSKLLTAGRGGAMLTHNAHHFQRAKIFAERGNDAFPLSQLQAAVLLPQIDKLAQRNQQRTASVQQLVTACTTWRNLQPVTCDQVAGEPAYYKLAFRCVSNTPRPEARDQCLAALQAEGLAVGPGFRGFFRRAPRRCRIVGSLTHSKIAAANTILLHHPVLLEPPDTISRVGHALGKVSNGILR